MNIFNFGGSFRFELCCITNTGKIRQHNEDNFCFFGEIMEEEHQSHPLIDHIVSDGDRGFSVALFDGMGGEVHGEYASRAAAEMFRDYSYHISEWTDDELSAMFNAMNKRLCDVSSERHISSMGTTAVMMGYNGKEIIISNIGDSRGFIVRERMIRQLTVDHDNRKMLESMGIKKKPALTQYLGMDIEEIVLVPDTCRFSPKKGDRYLICSDGLTDMVSPEEICFLLSRSNLQDDTEILVETALQNGGVDNITLITCEVK